MFKLLKNVECYTPDFLGTQDILIAVNKIAIISPDIALNVLPCVRVYECAGKIACPGLLDQHLHITGGGGEQGPKSIIEPISCDRIITAGVTTVVGILGADAVGKSMQGLLMKARSLETEGITTYIYSGNYGVPPVTITGSILTDITLIDKSIGAGEIAISDHRSSYPNRQELIKLAHEAITGGMLGKKAGIVHLHVGNGKDGLAPLLDLLESTDFPSDMFVPTHLNRKQALFEQAMRFHENGGIIDLTAGENTKTGCGVPDCLQRLLESRGGLDRVTVSSDGNGSGAGESGNDTALVMSLFNDIRTSVIEYDLPIAQVLRTVTENVARVLKLYPSKGKLAVGSDADILLIDKAVFMPDMLFAGGRLMLQGGKPVAEQSLNDLGN